MKRSLKAEIQQSKPFATIEEEVYLEIQRTAQVTYRWGVEALKPFGINPSHLNVLRILRGAHPQALSAGVIHERMVNRDPDVTRLLDRLEADGLVEKSRDEKDRRVVNVRITKAGRAKAEAATAAVLARLQQSLGPMGPRKLEQLADLLDLARRVPDTNHKEATP